jgi:citrate synthase
MVAEKRYMTAEEAAAALEISRATLYAYVSRGLIRSEPAGAGTRAHRYYREDIERLHARQKQRRNPAAAAQQAAAAALHFGTPVLASGLTLIAQGHLYYRGRDVLELAQEQTLEQVATLLWTGETREVLFSSVGALPEAVQALRPHLARLAPLERLQMVLPTSAAADAAAYDRRPRVLAQTGARILSLLVAVAAGEEAVGSGFVATLQRGWGVGGDKAARLLNAALVLCADHELNVSSFTARCVASAGSTLYGVVLAGLAALQGTRHGGHTARVAALLREVEAPQQARDVLAGRLRRGENIPGFGHRLYPKGDPRGRLLG